STEGSSILLMQATGSLTPVGNSYVGNGTKSFAFNGIGDGDYLITAIDSRSQPGSLPDMSVSDPIRITVKGSDVTGVVLTPKPLISVSGRIVLEPSKLTECQNKRTPELSEATIYMFRSKKDLEVDLLAVVRSTGTVGRPEKDGSFSVKNLRAGNYAVSL